MPSSNPALLLDNLTTAVLQVDPTLRLVCLNTSARELLGLGGAAVLGEALPRLLPRAESLHAATLGSLARQQGATLRELLIPLGGEGDTAVTADCTFSPLDADGLLLEIVPLDRHLLISREAALLAEQQTRRRLAQTLAHEIKNPLGGLRGAAQLLARELPDPALAEYTGIIVREADRLRALVDSLLGPAQRPHFQLTNIHTVLEHVRQLTESATGHALQRDYDPSVPEIPADADQLIQVFLNLVQNAVQAGAAQVLLRTRVLRQYTIGGIRHRLVLCTEVQDNGPGIPDPLRASLFFPMVSGRTGGTGLGLSVAQDIVVRHGGLIEYDSRPGHTVFRVVLPGRREESGHEQNPA